MAVESSMEAMSYIISFSETDFHHHAHGHLPKVQHDGHDEWKVAKELSISVICIVLGIAMAFSMEKLRTPGLLLVFFGAQTGMNMYMKAVFSTSEVLASPPGGGAPWMGFQASFFITAMQQVGSFIIFWSVYGPAKLTGCTNYKIKVLESKKEVIAVLCFAASFTCNIALNNFSLMLMPLTLNLIIRSCLPLSTFAAQWILKKMETGEGKPVKPLEIGLMALGVAMAGVCAWAQVSAKAEAEGKESKGGGETSRILLGIIVCVVSLFAGSANLALAGLLGTSVKLDSAGTVVYNSIPAACILFPLILTVAHPIGWSGQQGTPRTDYWVANQVWANSKSTFALAASSSLASLVYNILQFGIVQYLSATHVAFAGNFNKAATIPLAILVGIDSLPQGKWGPIMIIGAIINIGAFTAYNMVTGGAGGHGGGGASKEKEKEKEPMKEPMKDAESSSGEDDDDESSSEGGCC